MGSNQISSGFALGYGYSRDHVDVPYSRDSRCSPILMYRSEACNCSKQSDICSLDFAVNRFLMKSFKTANVNVIFKLV